MRIGLIAPPWIAVPPPVYGGTEVVVDNLARGLADRGHDVRLFTIGESTCPVPKSWFFDRPAMPLGAADCEGAHALAAYEAFAEVDVIHDHTVLGPLLGGPRPAGPPVALTVHGPSTVPSSRLLAEMSGTTLVAISHAQRALAPNVPFHEVIHHGIDLSSYAVGPGGGGYLMFLGRMNPDKGVHRAVEIARAAGKRLIIVSKMWEEAEKEYFETRVKPLLHSNVEILFKTEPQQRIELLRRAEALLNPISWPEPFGLVMAEALACGTPVLTCPTGAAPEIVDDGITGFLATGDDELVAAVGKVGALDRWDCREAAEQRFSLAKMAQAHEQMYERMIEHRHQPRMTRPRSPMTVTLPTASTRPGFTRPTLVEAQSRAPRHTHPNVQPTDG